VNFIDPDITHVDTCVDVTDTFAGFLGTVCYDDPPPVTFTYSRWIGPYEDCGTYTVENTATYTTNNTGSSDTDSWTVDVEVPCVGGCTLTQGYWKTHSKYGRAPYDDTWDTYMGGETLFLYGQNWYTVFWTPPRGGDPYYILAHQYMAAKLNILNGASSTPEVMNALNDAWTWLQSNEPGVKLRKFLRYWPLHLAFILSQYNEGLIGPGHCSE
jgi:hypothetical protein